MPTLRTLTALLCLTAMHTCAQVTLYDITQLVASQTIVTPDSVSVSAVGTNSNGETTYVEVVVQTSVLVLEPSTTITALSVPITYTQTFVEDASGWHGTVPFFDSDGSPSFDAVESCSFGSDGPVICSQAL
ncbi:hypothetical protein B0H19DRAFT_1272503 [Mycena capillaripes]|nr:hypothetical protein B0H19DRAFT_1277702 [Mycena capillaripes]KAJ6533101.1 hypothetical protein B0H19DRAFT_1272503 [Mycena capillaripes]